MHDALNKAASCRHQSGQIIYQFEDLTVDCTRQLLDDDGLAALLHCAFSNAIYTLCSLPPVGASDALAGTYHRDFILEFCPTDVNIFDQWGVTSKTFTTANRWQIKQSGSKA